MPVPAAQSSRNIYEINYCFGGIGCLFFDGIGVLQINLLDHGYAVIAINAIFELLDIVSQLKEIINIRFGTILHHLRHLHILLPYRLICPLLQFYLVHLLINYLVFRKQSEFSGPAFIFRCRCLIIDFPQRSFDGILIILIVIFLVF